jgi:hypothetical protein
MNFIEHLRELSDSNYLIQELINSNWMDKNVILVNCSPQYSSRLTQLINHKTSYLAGNQLYEQINLELPTEIQGQIWSYDEKEYLPFDRYLNDWIRKHIIPSNSKYLFITNTIFTGRNLNKVRLLIKSKLELEDYRFLSLYSHESSVLKPDFCIKKFNNDPPVFFWENKNPSKKNKSSETY